MSAGRNTLPGMGGAQESALMQFAFRQRRDFWKEARVYLLAFGGCLFLGMVDQWLCFHADGLAGPLSIAAGFAFACLLRFSWKVLGPVSLGLLSSKLLFGAAGWTGPVVETLAIVAGLSAILFLLHKWSLTAVHFEKAHDILGPFVFCAALAAGVASLLVANVRMMNGLVWAECRPLLLRDFFGLLAGIALFAPGFYLLLQGRKYLSPAERGTIERALAFIALGFTLIPAGIVQPDLIDPGLLVAAPLPVLLWMALSFGLRTTSAGIIIAVLGTLVLRYVADSSFPEELLFENGLYHFFACLSGMTLLILALQRDLIVKETIRMRLSLAAADYCAWDWTFEGGLFFRSPAWARRIGVAADKPFPLEAWIATVHPDEHEQFAAAINAGAKGSTHTFNMRFRSRDVLLDEWFWSKSIGLILRTDANGRPLQAVGIIVDINDAIEMENVRMAAMQKDAELTALRSQLNPHFLFNCLNSIRALIGLDTAKAREMITTLSVLLRYQLRTNRESLDTVEAEMAVVERYLQIEQTRFGQRLKSRIEVDPRSLQCTIPGMLILTLVENAVKHGISKLAEGGLIHIETRMSKKGLIIRVVNTGSLDLSAQGVGLENTRRRIKLLAGQFASFDIHEIRFGMVEAEIVLPRESLNVSFTSSDKVPVESSPFSI